MPKKNNFFPSQAIILAAGKSSRFSPLDKRDCHKSTFVLMGEALISRTVRKLVDLGITDIIIVKSKNDVTIEKILAVFQDTVTLRFRIQDTPQGMGNALLSLSDELQEKFLLLNPQQENIDEHLASLLKHKDIVKQHNGVVLLSQTTVNPEKYGMLALEGYLVTRVIEKPKSLNGFSDQRILGIYILDLDFVNFMRGLKSNEYQLEEAFNLYSQQKKVIAIPSNTFSFSLKYVWDLFTIAHQHFLKFKSTPIIHPNASIHKTAFITGAVRIEAGAKIYEYAIIQGPCYIGRNAVIGSYCKIRNESIIEEDVELHNSVEVKHSIIGKGTHIHSGFVGDSIIGENVRIGAGFITANRRLDRNTIRITIKGQRIDTKTTFFGSLIGDNVQIGIHCGINPGTIISSYAKILPMTMISNPPHAEE